MHLIKKNLNKTNLKLKVALILTLITLLIITLFVPISQHKNLQLQDSTMILPTSYQQIDSIITSYPTSYTKQAQYNLPEVNSDNYITLNSKNYFSFNLQDIDMGSKDRPLRIFNFKVSNIDKLKIYEIDKTFAYIKGPDYLIKVFIGLGETGGIYEFVPDPIEIPNRLNTTISRISFIPAINNSIFTEDIEQYKDIYFYTSDSAANIRAHNNCVPQGIKDPYCGNFEISYKDEFNENNQLGVFCAIKESTKVRNCDEFIKNLEIRIVNPLVFENQDLLSRDISVLKGGCEGPQSGKTIYSNKENFNKGFIEINNLNLLENNEQFESYNDFMNYITDKQITPKLLNGIEFLVLFSGCTSPALHKYGDIEVDYPGVDKSISEIGLLFPQAVPQTINDLTMELRIYALKGDYIFKIEEIMPASKILNSEDFDICSTGNNFNSNFFNCLSNRYKDSSEKQLKANQFIQELIDNYSLKK